MDHREQLLQKRLSELGIGFFKTETYIYIEKKHRFDSKDKITTYDKSKANKKASSYMEFVPNASITNSMYMELVPNASITNSMYLEAAVTLIDGK